MKIQNAGMCALLVSLALLPGCASHAQKTDSERERFAGIAADEEAAAAAVGRSMGENMLKSFRDGSYMHFAKDLDEARRRKFTEKDFRQMRGEMLKQMGEIRSVCYLTVLNQTLLRDYVWRVSFAKKNPKDGKDVVREMLFRVIVGKLDGKYTVLGFGFN